MVNSQVIDLDFWKGKTVLLTGHTGFKGAWLSLWLKKLGVNLVGYSLDPPSEPNLFTLADVESDMISIKGNIEDLNNLNTVLNKYNTEIVIHMADQSLVRKSYANPVETYMTNVIGTLNVFEAVRNAKSVKAVVNVTSDKCYENKEKQVGYVEENAMGGYDPYSSSKGCSELLTSAYRRSFFNESNIMLGSVRAGNVIGGGDWAEDRLLPDIFKAIIKKEKVKIRNPKATRPWQHVLEPIGGYLHLAQRLFNDGSDFAEGWNFGPDESDVQPVEWVVNKVINEWGDGASWDFDRGEHPHEANLLMLDCAKAKKRLGWQPTWNIDKALINSVSWYKAYANNEDVKELTISQISEYQNEINQKGLLKA